MFVTYTGHGIIITSKKLSTMASVLSHCNKEGMRGVPLDFFKKKIGFAIYSAAERNIKGVLFSS